MTRRLEIGTDMKHIPQRAVWGVIEFHEEYAMHQSLPHPQELDQNPELALLESLQLTMELTTRMLAAAHPDLYDDDDERPYWVTKPSPPCEQAHELLEEMARMEDTIARYRRHLVAERERERAGAETEGLDF